MRRPIVVANWKLHKLRDEAREFVGVLRERLASLGVRPGGEVEVVIAPPFTALAAVHEARRGSGLGLAAQDVCAERAGALTGEVSAAMLADAGCDYCLVGHSERRTRFGETSHDVAAKARALLDGGVRPIVCVGETSAERDAGDTERALAAQLDESLGSLREAEMGALVVAYEPLWAIGTGVTATPAHAQAAQRFIRERLGLRFGPAAEAVRIQYGGSVKPENAASLLAEPEVDGLLVGGASLEPESFARIAAAAAR
jgi:triosephosphate isomerase